MSLVLGLALWLGAVLFFVGTVTQFVNENPPPVWIAAGAMLVVLAVGWAGNWLLEASLRAQMDEPPPPDATPEVIRDLQLANGRTANRYFWIQMVFSVVVTAGGFWAGKVWGC